VRAKRSKSGAVSFDVLATEVANHARSSESVAALPAPWPSPRRTGQPRESLTATIKGVRAGEQDRTFATPAVERLDIVRKTLGQHQIAAIHHGDRPGRRHREPHHHARPRVRRMDRLGLAGVPNRRHGEPPPHGAALTYARRYALFTLVVLRARRP